MKYTLKRSLCIRSDSHPNLVVQFDQEMSALEAQLPDFCPAERIDFGVSLKQKGSDVEVSLTETNKCLRFTIATENISNCFHLKMQKL